MSSKPLKEGGAFGKSTHNRSFFHDSLIKSWNNYNQNKRPSLPNETWNYHGAWGVLPVDDTKVLLAQKPTTWKKLMSRGRIPDFLKNPSTGITLYLYLTKDVQWMLYFWSEAEISAIVQGGKEIVREKAEYWIQIQKSSTIPSPALTLIRFCMNVLCIQSTTG